MTDREIMQEIEDLRKQLQSLSAARGSSAAPESAAEGPPGEPEGEVGVWLRDIVKQAEEVIGGLDLHIKDVPATTALLIFTLGVLTGRLLSRKG